MPKAIQRPIPPEQERLYRLRDIEAITGHSRACIYNWMNTGRFPKQIKLYSSAVWRKTDIDRWLDSQGVGA